MAHTSTTEAVGGERSRPTIAQMVAALEEALDALNDGDTGITGHIQCQHCGRASDGRGPESHDLGAACWEIAAALDAALDAAYTAARAYAARAYAADAYARAARASARAARASARVANVDRIAGDAAAKAEASRDVAFAALAAQQAATASK